VRFIYLGSGGAIYGALEHKLRRPKASPARGGGPLRARLASFYLGCYARTRGLAWVSLRYASVYGPRQIPHGEAGVVAIFMQALEEDREMVIYRPEGLSGSCPCNYVYVGGLCPGQPNRVDQGSRALQYRHRPAQQHPGGLAGAIQRAAGHQGRPRFGLHRAGYALKNALRCEQAAVELGWLSEAGLAETWAAGS
jgi:UDP-glucose 4-epimerase